MEISKLIRLADEWAGNGAQIRGAISRAETVWNGKNDNSGVVEKVISNEDLLAVDGSDEMKSFIESVDAAAAAEQKESE